MDKKEITSEPCECKGCKKFREEQRDAKDREWLQDMMDIAKADAEAIEKEEAAEEKRQERIMAYRKLEAKLWEMVDLFVRGVNRERTKDLPVDHIVANKVRARVATAIVLAFDDGSVYSATRYLAGTKVRPFFLAIDHSDPESAGEVFVGKET